jgi:hypothetical protein
MKQLGFSVDGVLDALNAQPQRSGGDGRAIMIISARSKEGVTSVARAVAEASGPGAVYGIDLDLKHNALARALMTRGALGPKMDGRVDGVSFYGVKAPTGAMIAERTPAFSLHRVGQTRMYAGLFDARALPHGGRVVISTAPHYWNALRASGAVAVVDAPALERSQVGLRVAAAMDGVVLVVGADAGAAPAAMAAKDALVNAGANLLGLVYAGATAPVMAIERLLRQAG